jgi:hypothetical protein
MELAYLGLLLTALSTAHAVGSKTDLDTTQLQLANALLENQPAITNTLLSHGISEALSFKDGYIFEGASPGFQNSGYGFTIQHCIPRIPTPTCTTLGLLTISTSTTHTPGGPISGTSVSFSPAQ